MQRSVETAAAAADLRVSDLILAPPPAAPHLPLAPFVDRVDAPAVVAYLEIMGREGAVMPAPQVTIAIRDAAGGIARTTVNAEVTVRRNRWAVARAVLPLSGLPPGPHVAAARIAIDGRAPIETRRPFVYAGAPR